MLPTQLLSVLQRLTIRVICRVLIGGSLANPESRSARTEQVGSGSHISGTTNRELRSNLTDLILWLGWLCRQINELDFRIIA